MLLFAASALLGVIPSYDPRLSVATLLAILGSVALYMVVEGRDRSREALESVGLLAMLVWAAFGAYLVGQYGHLGFAKGGFVVQAGRATTLLPDLHLFRPDPNAAAAFLEGAVPLGVALALSARRFAPRAILALASLIVLYALLLTASRGAWASLAATGGIAAAMLFRRLSRRAAVVAVVLGVAAVATGLFAILAAGGEELSPLASTFDRALDRGRLFRNSLYLAGDHAFTGIGLGETFAMVYSRYSLLIQVPFLTYAHNLPLSIWLGQGLLGLIAFGGIVASFYLMVYRTLRRGRPRPLFHGAWLGATASLLHGLTDAPQYAAGSNWVTPALFVSMALAAGAARLALADSDLLDPARPRPAVGAFALGAVLALACMAIGFNQPLRALWHTNLGAIEEARAELAPHLAEGQRAELRASAEAEYRRALSIDASSPNASRRLGNLLVKLDRFDEAVPLLETALRREPGKPATLKGLGLAYVWVGRTEEAARLFLALDDPPEMREELITWGWFRGERGEHLLSAYAYETAYAMDLGGARADDLLRIADAFRAAGRLDAARGHYLRALALEPADERALRALGEIDR